MNYMDPYVYDYGTPGLDIMAGAVLSICLLVMVVFAVVYFAGFIIHSVGLYTIARRLGHENAWLAFIPVAKNYLHGDLAGELTLKKRTIRNPGLWKLLIPVAAGVTFAVFYFIIAGVAGVLMFTLRNYHYSAVSSGTLLVIVGLSGLSTVVAIVYKGVYKVLCILIDAKIYEKFTTRNMAVVHAALSALIPLYGCGCMLLMRNRPFCSEMTEGQNQEAPAEKEEEEKIETDQL